MPREDPEYTDPKTDIFALGSTIYSIIEGQYHDEQARARESLRVREDGHDTGHVHRHAQRLLHGEHDEGLQDPVSKGPRRLIRVVVLVRHGEVDEHHVPEGHLHVEARYRDVQDSRNRHAHG
jgi:hypothetical protein